MEIKWLMLTYVPQKTKMTMENQAFEDVYPIHNISKLRFSSSMLVFVCVCAFFLFVDGVFDLEDLHLLEHFWNR